ncbi:MAG: aminoacyl-tRNA hydrolase [Verrucomicrobiae bacterium]|nr:aminoacyl-tRNA hydrolase [Verrucomicrobiae bacterium]
MVSPEDQPHTGRVLLVGLGNPGVRYERTRHNVGFDVLDALAGRMGTEFVPRPDWKAHVAEGLLGQRHTRALLLKPQTFMNLSGEAVAAAVRWFKLDPASQVVVILDEVALPFGRIRIRPHGSAGGHNGLQSVIDHLGTPQFARVRIGVGERTVPGMELADHVLGKFSREEWGEVQQDLLPRVLEALAVMNDRGIGQAMNQFNQAKEQDI